MTHHAYHGVWAKNLARVRQAGLVPGVVVFGAYYEPYSEYDDGRHLFFSDDEAHARHYGDMLLRFPWPEDAKPDMNKYMRMLPNQFVTKTVISPSEIDILIDDQWVPLVRDTKVVNKLKSRLLR